MKSTMKKLLPAVMLVALAACAEQQNWQPTVDTANDKHANRLGNDLAACRQLASHASDQGTTVGEDTAIGAVGGAAGGALLGAIVGAPGTGAAIGAVTGTGVGLGTGATNSDTRFRRAYSNCMRQRGHPVID